MDHGSCIRPRDKWKVLPVRPTIWFLALWMNVVDCPHWWLPFPWVLKLSQEPFEARRLSFVAVYQSIGRIGLFWQHVSGIWWRPGHPKTQFRSFGYLFAVYQFLYISGRDGLPKSGACWNVLTASIISDGDESNALKFAFIKLDFGENLTHRISIKPLFMICNSEKSS